MEMETIKTNANREFFFIISGFNFLNSKIKDTITTGQDTQISQPNPTF